MTWIALPAILAVLLTFASILGYLAYRARLPSNRIYALGAAAFGGLVFLPTCLILPASPWIQGPAWALAIGVAAAGALRPAAIPSWVWTPATAWHVLAVSMALILPWTLAQGPAFPETGLAVPAALAAGLAWGKARAARSLAA